jgi:hypothetical protein
MNTTNRRVTRERLLLLLQLPLVALILAMVPGNWLKLVALLCVWRLTFRSVTRAELVVAAVACIFFTAMNAQTLAQGIFEFSHPDVMQMPVYELLMWGFYLIHTRQILGGPPPMPPRWPVWLGAIAYSACFGLLKDPGELFGATATVLALALVLSRNRWDLVYVGYMVALGAAIEYTGVLSGQWSYPAAPSGGVPIWFVTLWGGVGFFLRRLVLPLLVHFENRALAQ